MIILRRASEQNACYFLFRLEKGFQKSINRDTL